MLVSAELYRLATDILGLFPESTWGNKYVLPATDYFIKWEEVFPVPDQSAKTCAEVILTDIIGHSCCPYDIHSDQGWNYESIICAELCCILEI